MISKLIHAKYKLYFTFFIINMAISFINDIFQAK
jgi:hypothetical protein